MELKERLQSVGFFLTLSEWDRHIEVLRQLLNSLDQFEPYAAYLRLTEGEGSPISSEDIQRFLNSNNHSLPKKELDQIIRLFDTKENGNLDFRDFLSMILARYNPEVRFSAAATREIKDIEEGERLSEEIEFILSRFFLKISNFLRSLKASPELESQQLEDKLFTVVSSGSQSNCIDFENLKKFFEDSKILPKDSEIAAILRYMDMTGSGTVTYESYKQFQNIINGRMKEIQRVMSFRAKSKNSSQKSPIDKNYQARRQRRSRTRSQSRGSAYGGSVSVNNFASLLPEEEDFEISAFKSVKSPRCDIQNFQRTERILKENRKRDRSYSRDIINRRNTQNDKSSSRMNNNYQSSQDIHSRVVKRVDFSKENSPKKPQEKIAKEIPVQNQANSNTQVKISPFSPEKQQQQRKPIPGPSVTFEPIKTIQPSQKPEKENLEFQKKKFLEIISESFKTLVDIAKEVEYIKQKLSLRQDYCLIDHYRFVCEHPEGIKFYSFFRYLEDIGVIVGSKQPCQLLFEKYDIEKVGYLSPDEFRDMIMPIAANFRGFMKSREQKEVEGNYVYETYFSEETLALIQELFSNLVEEVELEGKVKKLLHLTQEEIKDVWAIINPKKKETITFEEVKKIHFFKFLDSEIYVRKWGVFKPEGLIDLNPSIH